MAQGTDVHGWVQITPVRTLMELDWPSYYGPDETFWAHEWEKHGTCAEDVFPTQLDYFNTTLALHVANPVEARAFHTWLVSPRDSRIAKMLEGAVSQSMSMMRIVNDWYRPDNAHRGQVLLRGSYAR